MQVEQLFKEIEDFLNDEMESNIFLKDKREDFISTYNNIIKNIEEKEQNELLTSFKHDIILELIRYIKKILLYDPLKPYYANFIHNWIFLVYNWNENICQSGDIKSECELIKRLNENYLTMSETISLLKNLHQSLNNLNQWSPPAFEISKHVINKLE